MRKLLGSDVLIEHVGSSAVGIGGKNIVDILIGVESQEAMYVARDILQKNGYFEGHDSHPDRIFMASSEAETHEGDYHVHICPHASDTCQDFIVLRDYLLANPEEAHAYYAQKCDFAIAAGHDRKKYRALKAEYVSELLKRAKKQNPA